MADPIEHLKQVLRKNTLDLIARAGGIQKIGAHEIAEGLVKMFASGGPSHEGDQLCREFVEPFVKSIHAEEKLREYFKQHPAEEMPYKNYWDAVN